MSYLRPALQAAVGGAMFLLYPVAGIAQEPPVPATSADVPPMLIVEWRNSELLLAGDVSSVAHEAILWQTASTLLPGAEIRQELRLQSALPPGWALVTELTVRAVARTRSSTAYIDESQVFIRGFTDDLDAWQVFAERLERNLLSGMTLRSDVSELRPGKSLAEYCTAVFESAWRGRRIGFARASATVNSSSYPLLDELVQLAADCPAATFTVTGHTGSSGNESSSRQLSKDRADAVVAYFVQHGIDASRFATRGAGSADPAQHGNDRTASAANRRIEVTIGFP